MVFKALADPTRRQVLELLKDRPHTAGELAGHFNLTKPTMSSHFSVLKAAELIRAERKGQQIYYHLNLTVLEDALMALVDRFDIGRDVFAAGQQKERPS